MSVLIYRNIKTKLQMLPNMTRTMPYATNNVESYFGQRPSEQRDPRWPVTPPFLHLIIAEWNAYFSEQSDEEGATDESSVVIL